MAGLPRGGSIHSVTETDNIAKIVGLNSKISKQIQKFNQHQGALNLDTERKMSKKLSKRRFSSQQSSSRSLKATATKKQYKDHDRSSGRLEENSLPLIFAQPQQKHMTGTNPRLEKLYEH